ncbi:MAG: FecR domain-containing protein [Opitutales bacterium]|nr:FecR domain-containing protein [Opitutales bacterium]
MKNNEKRDPMLSEIEAEAAAWVIRHERGLTADEQDRLNEWLTSDPEHRRVYKNYNLGWSDLDRLVGLQASYSAPIDPGLLSGKEHSRSKIYRFENIVKVVVPLVACLLLCVALLNRKPEVEPIKFDTTVKTHQMERIRNETLEDGSKIEFNWDALAEVEYTSDMRLVRLIKGEANFVVQKDIERPFIVDVDGVRVKAVGTEFNVKRGENQLDVIVTEGLVVLENVRASESEDGFSEEALLKENFKAVIDFEGEEPSLEVTVLENQEVEEALFWKPKLIHFENVTLDVIVDEFNKRNIQKIVLADPSLKHIQLNSVFWSDNIAGFVRLLESTFQIQASFDDEGQIFLSRIVETPVF